MSAAVMPIRTVCADTAEIVAASNPAASAVPPTREYPDVIITVSLFGRVFVSRSVPVPNVLSACAPAAYRRQPISPWAQLAHKLGKKKTPCGRVSLEREIRALQLAISDAPQR